MNKKQKIIFGIVVLATTSALLYWNSLNPLSDLPQEPLIQTGAKAPLSPEKEVLKVSHQKVFALSKSDGLTVPLIKSLPKSTITETATTLKNVQKLMKTGGKATTLEEYILFAAFGAFSDAKNPNPLDPKQICTLPVKNANALMAIVDQFFARTNYPDKKREEVSQTIKEYLSWKCGCLNVQTEPNSREAYLMEALKTNTPIDVQKLKTLPIKNISADFLVERGYIFVSSFAENSKVSAERMEREEPVFGSKFGRYKQFFALNSPQWTNKEYRLALAFGAMIDDMGSWGIMEHAKQAARSTNATVSGLGKKFVAFFGKIVNFTDANYATFVEQGEKLDAECNALTKNPVRSCVNNKIILAYLAAYKQDYTKALKYMKEAKEFVLYDLDSFEKGTINESTKQNVYKMTKLGLGLGKLYLEMGQYEMALEEYRQETKFRPFFHGNIDLRIILDSIAQKTPFASTTFSR